MPRTRTGSSASWRRTTRRCGRSCSRNTRSGAASGSAPATAAARPGSPTDPARCPDRLVPAPIGGPAGLADTSVAIRQVEKAYGGVRAVDGVSLEIRRGEFFSILGPSGSGKTTLLRLLAGFERPDRGEILIEGRSMRDVPPNRRPVNLVFQHYALFPHLTAFRNVAFGLEMQRRPRPEIDARVRAALAMVRLHEHHDRYPAQLSGGEQQRVALARAL